MPRVRKGAARAQARKRILRKARGYYGSNSTSKYRARNAVVRAGVYAFRDRRRIKRDYRKLWITRITAACKMRGTRYSLFMNGLKNCGILLNRKMLSELAIHDPKLFDTIVQKALAAATSGSGSDGKNVRAGGNVSRLADWGAAAVATAAAKGAKRTGPAVASKLMDAPANKDGAKGGAKGGKGDIQDIEGIGPAYATKLSKAGIAWIKELREKGRTKAGRATIAEQSGLPEANILSWVNMADMMRVEGINANYAELLHAAGVDTVKELSKRVPANLHKALTDANNGEKRIAPDVPSEAKVSAWVEKAKTMPAGVDY